MKKFYLTLFYICLYTLSIAQNGYKCKDFSVNLEVLNTSECFVILSDSTSSELKETLTNGFKLRDNSYILKRDNAILERTHYYLSDFYTDGTNNIVVVLPKIVMSVKNSNFSFDKIRQQYDIRIESNKNNKIVIICNVDKSQDVLHIIKMLSEQDNVVWCEPEMLSNYKLSNTLYDQQYYLRNTGQNGGVEGIDINVEQAWSIANGDNVVVAVLDDGVDFNHEDLQSNLLIGYTIGNPDGFGVPQNFDTTLEGCKGHGIACAGIIAANNNNIGIRGIASDAKILPVNIVPGTVYAPFYFGFASSVEIAKAINWAWKRADILSCSWNGGSYSSEIENAIDSAITFGRNGRGTIVVFSSGNDFFSDPYVEFPANINGVLTVGAIKNRGNIWIYSQRGSSMDLVAPSGSLNLSGDVVTLDRMGSLGFNKQQNSNYTNGFGGTSAACPQVAGVAALVLSINPSLTAQQVMGILNSTAIDLGPLGFDTAYGHGLVNAYEAVKAALDYDLYTKDHSNDNGVEPSDIGNNGFYSPDIWVRRNRDGGTTHQEAVMGDTNYVYVKIHNNGNSLSSISDSIRLFMKRNITSANPVLSYQYWPSRWQQVAVAAIPPVPGNGERTVCLPVKYDALFNSHTLLSRIESQNDLLSVSEVPLTLTNVKNNNNISIKNSSSAKYFLYDELGSGLFATALASEVSDYNPFKLRIRSTNFEPETNILDEAEVTVILSDNLAYYWQNNNIIPEGLKHIYNNTYLVENEDVVLDGFEVPEGYDADITLKYNFLTRKNTNNETYYNTIQRYNVIAYDNDELVGGLTIQIDKPERLAADRFHANAGNDTAVLLNTTATLHATQINENATYRWYDKQRNFKYEGVNYSVVPSQTSEYILEVTAESDGYRDLDTVKVNVVPGCIRSITPNPVSDNWITVGYEYATTVTSAQLLIYNTGTSALVGNYDLSNMDNVSSLDIEVTTYPTGSYTVVLVCDNSVCHSKVLIRQ